MSKLHCFLEHGDYMALDLGGTNFRVILLKLRNGQIMAEIVKYFHVPEEIQLGPGHNLFDFLAECIKEFMTEHEILDKTFPLGFCFSFPMDHISLRAATLTSWTKSFKCSGVVGEEVVQMLNDALADKGISVDRASAPSSQRPRAQIEHGIIVGVVKQLEGSAAHFDGQVLQRTLISGAQTDQKCAIGLILGTGSNACYIERTDRIPKWEGDHEEQEVIIDIEWGAFGDNGVLDFLKTDYDRDVDAHSVNPSIFTFEKYFSGKFLGEVVRYILVALTREGLLFNGHGSEKLFKPNTFGTANISKIEDQSYSGSFRDTLEGTAILNLEHILEDLSISFDNEDADIIQYVCAIVSDRAARLISSCLANLINRMEKPTPSIAVDGSLYKYHPRLRFLMEYYMQRMTRPDIKFKFIQAEDGSGKGAGLMAAIARRLEATTK
ncbi:unnamed protein product [Cyprideis torosa]|uniref:Phosphotransferase n=1 Tax=Cyprideis torosa TaxID=163714 RepID=A0A7R8WL39_9CRUS|nr:unnamed protein product [Cyprideis torosa]CAG0902063.1 unnamed protein product [Cyprideis torosa]